MKTRVPETITCVNCGHNVIIKLYKVDTTINSSQGHFHTIHNPDEPAYTVYCINCGHFMTNDPDFVPPKPQPKARPSGSAVAKQPALAAKTLTTSPRRKKDKPVAKKSAKPAAASQKPANTRSKDSEKTGSRKAKQPQRKKAK